MTENMSVKAKTEFFAAVYLNRSDETAEVAEQVMRATAGVMGAALESAGGWLPERELMTFMTEADTGSESPGVVISTAKLSEEDATTLWQAYPYDEVVLNEWEAKGWVAVGGE